MYQKDKVVRLTLRLNEEQFTFVQESSEIMGVSPSEFLRMVVNAAMSMSKKLDDAGGLKGRENDESNILNIV